MKARVKKHGPRCVTLAWFAIGMDYRVVQPPVVRTDGKIEFRIWMGKASPDTLCVQYWCYHLGGQGSEWEFVDDDDATQDDYDDYDRAMGVL